MSRSKRKSPGYEIHEPPEGAMRVALKRCTPFLTAALNLHAIGQDYLNTLIVSCYLQGVCDGSGVRTRKEGAYEEER